MLSSEDIFHNFVLRKETAVEANGGKTKRGRLRIKRPGTYEFWCSVPGHRAAGMEGVIVVERHRKGQTRVGIRILITPSWAARAPRAV